MINNIQNTELYKNLSLDASRSNSHLFYSADTMLNNIIALTFAKSIICENKNACGKCNACIEFDNLSHPDYYLLDIPSIKVEDINLLISKITSLPIQSDKKVFVILNAENINEIAQNKLLKTLEEPSENNIFILSSSNTEKLLPTVMSRLNKHFVPRLSKSDKIYLKSDLENDGINLKEFLEKDISLNELYNLSTNENYKSEIATIEKIFSQLNSTQDIPKVVSSVNINKQIFFTLLENIFIDCINGTNKYPNTVTNLINYKFNRSVLLNSIHHIEDANKKLNANVNSTYILDNLLFKILKEKYLCK